MDNKIELTQEELQLLYTACMSYGDRLSGIVKSIPNEEKMIVDSLSNRAKDSWNLAQKITSYLKEGNAKKENKLIEVVEVCPHCMSENVLLWDSEKDGFEVACKHCGEKIMLCDACLHAEDNKEEKCDWCQENGCFRKQKRK